MDTEAELTRSASPTYDMSSTNVGRTGTGFPRTVPLSPSKTGLDSAQITPLKQTSTGTRYGAALGGGGTPSPVRQWGGGTPQCGRCGKSVYFAEQVRCSGMRNDFDWTDPHYDLLNRSRRLVKFGTRVVLDVRSVAPRWIRRN